MQTNNALFSARTRNNEHGTRNTEHATRLRFTFHASRITFTLNSQTFLKKWLVTQVLASASAADSAFPSLAPSKYLERRNYGPGVHAQVRRSIPIMLVIESRSSLLYACWSGNFAVFTNARSSAAVSPANTCYKFWRAVDNSAIIWALLTRSRGPS